MTFKTLFSKLIKILRKLKCLKLIKAKNVWIQQENPEFSKFNKMAQHQIQQVYFNNKQIACLNNHLNKDN